MNSILDIFIVTYNREKYLVQSIQSVLSQSYKNFNLYILDNCSTDNTQEAVKDIADERLHYIRHTKNIGAWGNIQWAFEHSQSKYFVVFHDDDIMKHNFIQQELELLESHDEYTMVSCLCDMIDEAGKVIASAPKKPKKTETFRKQQLFESYIEKRQFIMFPTIMYRRDFVNNHLKIKIEAGPSADLLLCLDNERYGGVHTIINSALVNYRHHKEQWSQVDRTIMVEELFTYFRNDSYYSELLKCHRDGQNNYYTKIMINELCLVADGKINWKEAYSDSIRYQRVLTVKSKTKLLTYLIITIAHIFPGCIKGIYYLGRVLKRRHNAHG